MRFCSLASVMELPHARSLADRIAEHHPGTTLTVLVTGTPALADEPFEILTMAGLGIGDWQTLGERYEHDDLSYLYRPHLLSRLIDDSDEPLVFLDAAHELFAPLEPVEALFERHPILLTPRLHGDLPEDIHRPSNEDLRTHGRIDPGFVGVRPGEDADRFIGWWTERVRLTIPYLSGAMNLGRPEQGRRQLRRLLDVAPSLFPVVGELDDPGCEVSPWNLHERPLTEADGRLMAAGRPLRSMNLSGYRPDRPHLAAAHATRVTPSQSPVLRRIVEHYAERLKARGWEDLSRRSEVGRRLANGLVFSDRLLGLHTQALTEGTEFGDIFSPEGTEAFMAWLRQPHGPGAGAGISRYLNQVYRDRPDIPVAYPDLAGEDAQQFIGWAWVFGRRELEIPEDFLPPPPPGIAAGPTAAAPVSVTVAGYFTGTLGLGEAARLYVAALRAAGVPVRTTTVDALLPVSQRAQKRGYGKLSYEAVDEVADSSVNLICVNAEELPRFAREVGDEFFAGRRNIGVWAWETDVFPAHWQEAMKHLDEIWVYSRYIAENLGRVASIPVVTVPPPVTPPPSGQEPDLGLPDGFRFMFMFDLFSTVERKNPVAVIEAFKLAFSPGEGPHLVMKTIHGDYRPAAFEQLAYAAQGRPDIQVVDEALSVAEKNGLLASCDCYVSLHRSEGYGLPLAECMAMGKPVIATGYSGNLDFMSPGNSYLVDYTLTQVGAEVEIYPASGTWADPSIEDAASKMRDVWEHQDEARRRGERAREDIAAALSPERVGAIARARLEHLAGGGAAPADGSSLESLRELEARLSDVVERTSSSGRGVRGFARRALFRVLRPVIVRQREIDLTLTRAVRDATALLDDTRRNDFHGSIDETGGR